MANKRVYAFDLGKAAISYMRLYELGKNRDIKGINGAKYIKDGGTKGEDLYKEVLKNISLKSKQNLIPIGLKRET